MGFKLVDYKGQQGAKGRTYHAWHLPNSYRGPHARLGRGRQRRLNRKLVDLRRQGDAGNGRLKVTGYRRYFRAANQAVRALRRRDGVIYWAEGSGRWGTVAWQVLGGDK